MNRRMKERRKKRQKGNTWLMNIKKVQQKENGMMFNKKGKKERNNWRWQKNLTVNISKMKEQ